MTQFGAYCISMGLRAAAQLKDCYKSIVSSTHCFTLGGKLGVHRKRWEVDFPASLLVPLDFKCECIKCSKIKKMKVNQEKVFCLDRSTLSQN